MKICKLIALLLLVSTTGIFAQDRIQNIGDFTEIKVFNGLSVEIERTDDAKVIITGKKTDDVVIKNVNGTLKLSLKFPEIFNPDDVKIKVYYNKDLHTLDANEGSAIFSDEELDQESLTVKTQEGAYINVAVNVKYLTIKAVTGASIRVRGNASNQEVEVTTGGVYEAYDLTSEYADVVSASGGRVEIQVTDVLDAKVRFGGNIFYKGDPKKVDKRKTMGGVIKNKG